MEIEGKIIAVLPMQSGTSARTGNEWRSQEYVIETQEQYPKKCVFRAFGADRIQQFNIQQGETLRVSFDVDAHEYNGRWYNSLNAWKVERFDPAAVQASGQAAQPLQSGAFPPPPPFNGGASQESGPSATLPADGSAADDLPF